MGVFLVWGYFEVDYGPYILFEFGVVHKKRERKKILGKMRFTLRIINGIVNTTYFLSVTNFVRTLTATFALHDIRRHHTIILLYIFRVCIYNIFRLLNIKYVFLEL